MKLIKAITFLSLIILAPGHVYAECDFKTGSKLLAIKDPAQIERIDISTPKSSKYAKNILRIVAAKQNPLIHNIPPELKKRFNANIKVQYSFGSCVFKGSVRQSGDLRDHIKFMEGGKAIRSLDVKLKEGNILSAVRFKLLLPETRNNANEILATLIFKELGFISPETFSVNTRVNGTESLMIFQEVARKELLERNGRREGPIFEGDEELIWSYGKHDNFVLEKLALARLTNKNWFIKGHSSQHISLEGFSKIQAAYLNYVTNKSEEAGLAIHPDPKRRTLMSNFTFLTLLMNGGHALRPHNRKFYFNSLSGEMEPVYYDGDISFSPLDVSVMDRPLEKAIKALFNSSVDLGFIEQLKRAIKSDNLKQKFLARAGAFRIEHELFFDKSISNLQINIEKLRLLINQYHRVELMTSRYDNSVSKYLGLKEIDLEPQLIVTSLEQTVDGYMASLLGGTNRTITVEEAATLISENRLDSKRAVFLADNLKTNYLKKRQLTVPGFQGSIFAASGVHVHKSDLTKTIVFTQSRGDDWVLITSAKLKGWNIVLKGVAEHGVQGSAGKQRFNEFGLTGCLTIYKSDLQNTEIESNAGNCEDALNIISSSGTISTVKIAKSFQDAVDFDFSKIEIRSIEVTNAGNDCLDVSGGDYKITSAVLIDCGDKGISVGEGASFYAEDLIIKNAFIGTSSKDLSKTIISNVKFTNVPTCIEAKQKKQEFGGAYLQIESLNCGGEYLVDQNSIFINGSK